MMTRTLSYVYKVSFLSGLLAVLSALTSFSSGSKESYAVVLLLIVGLIQMAAAIATFVPIRKFPERFDQYFLVILIATSLIGVLDWYVNGVNILIMLILNVFCAILTIIVLYERKKYGHKETDDSERSDI